MNASEMKEALIFGINNGKADKLISALLSCIETYPKGDQPAMMVAILGMRIETKRLIRALEKNKEDLEEIRREAVLDAIEYSRRQRNENMKRAGLAAA